MVIRKRAIISWLLDENGQHYIDDIGIPMADNKIHFQYLYNGLETLANACTFKPDWGLPVLIMPSFEEVMGKSARSFFGIDHQLFQEFSNEGVCGILLEGSDGTIVYGYKENKLYVWVFNEDFGKSSLKLYFYAESTKDNTRIIYTWPTLLEDEQLFKGDKDERKQIYETLVNRLVIYQAVRKYVQVETIEIPSGTITKLDGVILDYKTKEKVKNDSDQKVQVMDSRWFRKIVNNKQIFVRGFFRFQRKKNEQGNWYQELIFVDSYVRNGYHRNALIEDENQIDSIGDNVQTGTNIILN